MSLNKDFKEKNPNVFDFFSTVFQLEKNIDISVEEYDSGSVFFIKEKSQNIPFAPVASIDATINSCKICLDIPEFIDPAEKRFHYLSSWHKTNIKRLHYKLRMLSKYQFQQLPKDSFIFENENVSQVENEENPMEVLPTSKNCPNGPWIPFLNSFSKKGLDSNPMSHFPEKFSIHVSLFEIDKSETILTTSVYETAKRLFSKTEYGYGFIFVTSEQYSISIVNISDGDAKWLMKESKRTYSCRKKQGGSQLLRDKKGKVATFSGSILRRQNELDLVRDAIEKLYQVKQIMKNHATCRIYASISSHLKQYIDLVKILEQPQFVICKFPSGLRSDKTEPENLFKEMISLGNFS